MRAPFGWTVGSPPRCRGSFRRNPGKIRRPAPGGKVGGSWRRYSCAWKSLAAQARLPVFARVRVQPWRPGLLHARHEGQLDARTEAPADAVDQHRLVEELAGAEPGAGAGNVLAAVP